MTSVHQPFSMDEFRTRVESGKFEITHSFQALAGKEHRFRDSLKLDAEQKMKRKLIMEKFGNAED